MDVRHRQHLLKHLHAILAQRPQLVARKHELTGQPDDRRHHLRLVLFERVAHQQRVGIGVEHDVVHEYLRERAFRLVKDVLPLHRHLREIRAAKRMVVLAQSAIAAHDVATETRSVEIARFRAGEVAHAAEHEAIFADALAQGLHAAVKPVGIGRVAEAGADFGTLELARRVGHAVELEELVAPLARSRSRETAQEFKCIGIRRIKHIASVPAVNGLAVRIVEEKVVMGVMERLVPRAVKRHPKTGTEPQRTEVVGEFLHPLRELRLVNGQVKVVKIAHGKPKGMILPRFNGPDVQPERLEVLRADSCFG